MKQLRHISKVQLLLTGVFSILLLAAATGGGYYAGTHRTQTASTKVSGSSVTAEQYDRSISNLQAQLNTLTNDYDSACNNYQTLYTAYDELYRKTGANSGLTQIAQPDGARGNEESCYR
jgi:uncharacterized protein involved in exopolysaccharide biosynthesis